MPDKKRFQFGLRTAIVLTVLAGLCVGFGVRAYRRRLVTIHVVNASGRTILIFGLLKRAVPEADFQMPTQTIKAGGECFFQVRNDQTICLVVSIGSVDTWNLWDQSKNQNLHVLPSGIIKPIDP